MTFTNINIGKSYPYAITKLKYFAGYGTLSITNKDSTVNVKLVTDATATPKEKKLTSVIFPNPASDQLNILSQKPISEVEIFSLTGKLVWSKTYQSATVQIPVTNFKPGEYIIRVSQDKVPQSYKIVISPNSN